MDSFYLGLDLGGTSVKAGVVNARGKVLAQVSEPTGPESADKVIAAMVHAGQRAVTEAGLNIGKITAVGVLSPGQVVIERGVVIRAANFPQWHNVKLRARVTKGLGLPGVMENDAKAAAYGEYWAGVGGNGKVDTLVIFTLGTGIGGGMVHRGNIYRGTKGFAAEVGHAILFPGGDRCGCGQLGCFEMYASAKNVGLRAAALLEMMDGKSKMQHVLDRNGALTAKDVQDAAESGDAAAKAIWGETCYYIALAAVNMMHHFDPDILVLGGGMSRAGNFLLDGVKKHFNKIWWKMTPPTCKIMLAKLGSDAGMVGAAGVAKQAFERDELPAIGK
jgi:glucokinase